MRYLGKIVGAGIGALAGPLGAIVGAWVGHQYDQQTHTEDRLPQHSFFDLCFAVMGHLAKSDGRVSEQEIQAARQIMKVLHLDEWHTQSAIESFTLGKNAVWPIETLTDELKACFRLQPELRVIFFELQFKAMFWGNALNESVRNELWRIAHRLGLDVDQFTRFELWAKSEYATTERPTTSDQILQQAYRTLNIGADATDEEVKKAYRRLMSENHPDKLVSKGLPESMLEVAKQKTQRIREAYERICEQRAIR